MAEPAARLCCLGWDFSTQQVLSRGRAAASALVGTPVRGHQAKPWAHLPLGLLGDPAPLPDDALPVIPLPPPLGLARRGSDLARTPPLPETAAPSSPRAGILGARGGEVPRGAGGRGHRGMGPPKLLS